MKRTISYLCISFFVLSGFFVLTGCGSNANQNTPDFSKLLGSFKEQNPPAPLYSVCIITEEAGRPYLRFLNTYTMKIPGRIWSTGQERMMSIGDTTTEKYGALLYNEEKKTWLFDLHNSLIPVRLEGDNQLTLDFPSQSKVFVRTP